MADETRTPTPTLPSGRTPVPDDLTIDALVNELVNSLSPAHHKGAATGAFATLEVEYVALRQASASMLTTYTAAVQAPLLERIKTLFNENGALTAAILAANERASALLRDLESRGAVVVQPPAVVEAPPVVDPTFMSDFDRAEAERMERARLENPMNAGTNAGMNAGNQSPNAPVPDFQPAPFRPVPSVDPVQDRARADAQRSMGTRDPRPPVPPAPIDSDPNPETP